MAYQKQKNGNETNPMLGETEMTTDPNGKKRRSYPPARIGFQRIKKFILY